MLQSSFNGGSETSMPEAGKLHKLNVFTEC